MLLPSSPDSVLEARRDPFNITGIYLLLDRCGDLILIGNWHREAAVEG